MDTIDLLRDHRRTGFAGADNPILMTLEQYWQTLRDADRIPARSAIEPGKIDRVLPHAFILQRVAPGIARIRVAGQKMHEFLKMDARGMPLSTLFQPEARDEIQRLVDAAFTDPAIVTLPLLSPGGLMQAPISGTMMLLPLRDHEGHTTRILGALVADGQRGTRPRRFIIGAQSKIRYDRLGVPPQVVALTPRAPVTTQRPNVSQRPALRLVVNNG